MTMFETTHLGSSKQNRVNPGPKTRACQARLGLLSIRALHELGICMPPVLHILEEVQFHDIYHASSEGIAQTATGEQLKVLSCF